MLNSIQAGLSKRWRLRLKAGALALFFAFLSLLPWAHVLTLGAHGGHGCCHAAAAEVPPGDAPEMAADDANALDACWVCDSLASLHHPTVLADLPAVVPTFFSSAYFASVPQAPAHLNIYPASRSQAPPANA